MAGLMAAAFALSGCSSLGSRTFGDQTTTASVPQNAPSSYTQPMPSSLGAPQVAENQFLPPANVGNGWNSSPVQTGYTQPLAPMAPVTAMGTAPTVQSQDLPVLSSPSPMGSQPAMQAQPAFAAAAPMPSPSTLGTLPTNSAVPTVAPAATGGTFTHTIASGESLYTIARRYDVTTQALVQANGLSSPDKIVVGQKVIIPGRADLLATKAPAPVQVASTSPTATPAPTLPAAAPNTLTAATPAPAPTPAQAAPAQPAPAQVANVPAAEPAMSGNTKFRWPVSGRVLTDFASSRGTGINIEASEGSAIKAAENGTVIYVGSGVEGYGNLILIRHPNGYVSAYAHLKSMSVAKGAVVSRGDTIGAAGMTGSVTQPQLHFELRKGATPVDPMPLLAS